MAEPTVLLGEAEVAERVAQLAQAIAPRIDEETVAVCLLTGGLWFCADLMRALARLGRHVRFDALWLASYGDARASLGRCEVRADLQRPLNGRRALIVDDVFDTGLSIRAVIDNLRRRMRRNLPVNLRVATVYFKPGNNRTSLRPDFYVHETDKWLVFPHELVGLTDEEIRRHKPEVADILEAGG